MAEQCPEPVAPSRPRVLTIAGSDSGGGAGIQADLKTVAAFGGYGLSVLTAVTAQNTQGVQAVEVLTPDLVRAQLDSVAEDIAFDAVKIGMLGTAAVMEEVAAWLERTRPPRVVLDPVMVATSGDALTDSSGVDAARLWGRLMDAADLVTPNLPELAALLGIVDGAGREEGAPEGGFRHSWQRACAGAAQLAARHEVAVLLKGGHLGEAALEADSPGSAGPSVAASAPGAARQVPDAIVTAEAVDEVSGPRSDVRSTHGTGCTLSSAVAVLAAWGLDWGSALRRAKPWLLEAMRAGPALQVGEASRGTWHGPVDHGVPTPG